MRVFIGLALATGMLAAEAHAAPGAPSSVTGPGVREGETEFELRTSYLTGEAEDGFWAADAEAGYGFTDWFSGKASFRFRGAPGRDDELTGVKLKGKFELAGTSDWPVHFGVGVELLDDFNAGPAAVDLRLLAEHQSGPFRARFNFDATRAFADDAAFDFGYRASAGYRVSDHYEIALLGFGDLGVEGDFGADGQEHYWGPGLFASAGAARLELGYLAGLDAARADGMLRFAVAVTR